MPVGSESELAARFPNLIFTRLAYSWLKALSVCQKHERARNFSVQGSYGIEINDRYASDGMGLIGRYFSGLQYRATGWASVIVKHVLLKGHGHFEITKRSGKGSCFYLPLCRRLNVQTLNDDSDY